MELAVGLSDVQNEACLEPSISLVSTGMLSNYEGGAPRMIAATSHPQDRRAPVSKFSPGGTGSALAAWSDVFVRANI